MTAMLLAALLLAPPDGHVTFVGSFHDLRFTEEHAYGSVLELWRDGDRLIGRWSRAAGPQADFPTVPLHSLIVDRASGALAFEMSWCGRVQRFEGTLDADTVSGRIVDVAGREREHVRLTRDREDERDPTPRASWQREWDATLERRRPRCG